MGNINLDMRNKKEVRHNLSHLGFVKNQRGQELSTNTIILIILGVIVLAVVALGFIMGWDKIKSIITGGDNNVDQVSRACLTACTTQSQYDFCSRQMQIKIGKESFIDTCKNFANPQGVYKNKNFGITQCTQLC